MDPVQITRGEAQYSLGEEGCGRFAWDGKYPDKGNKNGQKGSNSHFLDINSSIML